MAKSGKVTPKVAERVAHYRRLGLGREAIAAKLRKEGIDLTGRTVSRVATSAPSTPSARKRAAALLERVAVESTAPPPPISDEDPVDHLRMRMREARALANELAPLSKEGGRNASIYCQLVRLEGDLAKMVVGLTPPARPDPSVDPANVENKALLIAAVEGLLAAEVSP